MYPYHVYCGAGPVAGGSRGRQDGLADLGLLQADRTESGKGLSHMSSFHFRSAPPQLTRNRPRPEWCVVVGEWAVEEHHQRPKHHQLECCLSVDVTFDRLGRRAHLVGVHERVHHLECRLAGYD